MKSDIDFMKLAISESLKCFSSEDVPVGSVIIYNNKVISKAHNEVEKRKDPTSHSEILAIKKALKKLSTKYLYDCTLYTTLEPCSMCAGAIILARVGRVVWGAYDPKAGAGGSVLNILNNPKLNHRPDLLGGVLEAECSKILKEFFIKLRMNGKGNTH